MTTGTSSVKTSVVKDGNVFMIHVIDPSKPTKEDESSGNEKSETEQSEKEKKEGEKCSLNFNI